jgi:hypothetical protein
MKKFPLLFIIFTVLTGCASFDMSAAHLQNTVPRFTTFTTESPKAMATCIDDHWAKSGYFALTTSQTDKGFALQTSQKLAADSNKVPMMYIEVNPSREGSSVRFYTNRTDEIADRSMISTIQRCH